jgi:tripartite ATP-independent transporter DctP family solute receptor
MKIKTKRFLFVLFLLLIALVVFFWTKPAEKVPEYVFSYAENQNEDYPTTLGGQYFANLVEEKTNGRIRILIQHSGERGNESQVISQLKYGGVDFARISISELTNEIKALNVLQLPYLYENSEHMWKVLDGKIGDYFLDVVSGYEMVGLSWYDAGARNFYTKDRPIQKLEDFEGLKIRVQESDMMASMVEYLGGEPVKKPYSEVYSLLEKSEADGAENNWPSYESMQHYEVAGYYTLDEHIRIPELQICSKHTWEKLSEEDQQIILECAKESSIYQRKLWKEQETKSRELAVSAGAEVVHLSTVEKKKFRKAVEPLFERYCGEHMDLIQEILSVK